LTILELGAFVEICDFIGLRKSQISTCPAPGHLLPECRLLQQDGQKRFLAIQLLLIYLANVPAGSFGVLTLEGGK
jgi:hypothetical protein